MKYDQQDSYPLFVLGCKFRPEKKIQPGQKYSKTEKKYLKTRIKKQYFHSLIWSTYRRNFVQGLLSDQWSKKYLSLHLRAKETPGKITTDMNWGCTLRVGQMLICNTLMRHLLIDDPQFHYQDGE